MNTDNRSTDQAYVRSIVDSVRERCDKLRECWPNRYPVPVDVDAAYNMEESVITMVRRK